MLLCTGARDLKKSILLAHITLTMKAEATNSVEMSITTWKITCHYNHVHSCSQPLSCWQQKRWHGGKSQLTWKKFRSVLSSFFIVTCYLNSQGLITKLHSASQPSFSRGMHLNGRITDGLTCKTNETNYTRLQLLQRTSTSE